jgi:nucleoside-diphosphate-sugar epimerase
MRIAVIGGTGFIGTRVIEHLAPDHEVMVLHRGKRSPPLPPSVRPLIGDRDKLAESAAEFRRFSPDVVLDMISGDEHHARAVVDAFAGLARRLVTISSMDVYRSYEITLALSEGPLEPVPLTEESPLRTVLYPFRSRPIPAVFDWVTPDYDKTLVERAARGRPDLPATILRLPMVYGPGDPLHRFFPFLKRMDDGRPAIVIEETWAHWRGCMGYVDEVAAAIALAVTTEAAAGRAYNIAEPGALTWADWARAVGNAAGWNGRILILPRDLTPGHLLPPFNAAQHWTPDSTRIRAELGYRETIPRELALSRTVQWERENPATFDTKAFDYDAEDRAIRSAACAKE